MSVATAPRVARGGSRASIEHRLEDLEFMAAHGETLASAAARERAGSYPRSSASGLERFLHREGRGDLVSRMKHNARRALHGRGVAWTW